ncbi:MAG: APC family permease, partial [Chthonomonadaceae bacterium]|nr:APC family permease [Chthonomonadaceae bacterium]
MSFLDRILGKPLATHEEEGQRVGVFAGIPMLGLDALASSAYGPEAALTLLIPLGAMSFNYITPIIGVILVLLIILYFSYRQTIAAYPDGGGSYTVAKENLGTKAGLLAAASLLLDYVLTVAVGISAGVGALVSAVPFFHSYTLSLCLLILVLIAVINLRGVRESGLAFALPTYVFIVSLFAVLIIGLYKTLVSGGHPVPLHALPLVPPATVGVTLWLLMRSFASGCTAMTGVEAVSNGVSAFANPGVKNAQKTLTAIVALLGLLLGGIAYLCRVYRIGAMNSEDAGYDSVISQLVSAIVGRGFFYYVTIGSVLAVLALSANTGFADFPRLCRLISQDNFLPHAFGNRGRRLVYSLGIIVLTVFSGALLIAFGGLTDRLIPLFAVGAFGAF